MTSSNETPATAPGSYSVSELLTGAAQAALRDAAHELGRADGHRGMVYLQVALCLGDGGAPLWVKSAAYFEAQRHHKDAIAREKTDG